MYGIVEEAQAGWTSMIGWVFLSLGVVALILLIVLDEIRKNPLLDLHIFKEKLIVFSALACTLGGIVSNVFMFFDPLYLRILRGLSPFLIGVLIAVIPAGQVLISFFFSRLVKRFGPANLLFYSILAAFIASGSHRFIQADTLLLF